MSSTSSESTKIVDIYLLIAQYPILARQIRRQMRQELFRRGIITPDRFAQEVREKAVLSQLLGAIITRLGKLYRYNGKPPLTNSGTPHGFLLRL